MNKLEKIVIFLVSTLLTLIGFNLIASPAVQILKIGRLAGYQIIANYLAKTGTIGLSSSYSMHLKLPIESLLILAINAIILFIVVKIGSYGKKTRKRPRQKPYDRISRPSHFQTLNSRMGF